jgi:hypothetical protein
MRVFSTGMTVGRLMAAIAIMALSWCMLLGIANLVTYLSHKSAEQQWREDAAILEARADSDGAGRARAMADEQRQLGHYCLTSGASTLALLALAIALAGVGLGMRSRTECLSGPGPALMDIFARGCLNTAKISIVSLIIGVIAYGAFLLFVLATDD